MALIPSVVLALSLHPAGGDVQKTEQYEQVTIQTERRVPGVDLTVYSLITSNKAIDRREADAIVEVKVSWPRAMQTKDAALFDRILARGFTFREADGRLLRRDAYIRDRVQRSEAVAAARYENVVLQVFGQMAVLSYRNIVSGTDADGRPETWHMSWVDIFVREDGRWKIGASHLISERAEKAVEQCVQRTSNGQDGGSSLHALFDGPPSPEVITARRPSRRDTSLPFGNRRTAKRQACGHRSSAYGRNPGMTTVAD